MKVGRISKSKEVLFETAYNDLAKRNSIEDRIGDNEKFRFLLDSNFKKMNIDLDFEYAIFNKDSITNIKSLNFENPNFFKQKPKICLFEEGLPWIRFSIPSFDFRITLNLNVFLVIPVWLLVWLHHGPTHGSTAVAGWQLHSPTPGPIAAAC